MSNELVIESVSAVATNNYFTCIASTTDFLRTCLDNINKQI